MIKAFIFDIGGVLIKTDKAILDAIELALRKNNIQFIDRYTVAHGLGKNNYINVKTAVKVSYTGKDIKEKVEKCFDAFESIFPHDVTSSFKIFPNVIDTLELLRSKGIKLAVFTGFNRTEAEFLFKRINLSKYFDFIVTVDDVKEPRPHPDALILAADRLNVKINECMYVGDAIADIQMAKNAQMTVVCVKTGVQDNNKLKKENPDYFVEDLSEMIEQLSSELLN